MPEFVDGIAEHVDWIETLVDRTVPEALLGDSRMARVMFSEISLEMP
jgi:hypothetical protein